MYRDDSLITSGKEYQQQKKRKLRKVGLLLNFRERNSDDKNQNIY